MKQAWIVEDDQEMSNTVSMMLKLLDFDIACFHNARSAAQALLSGSRPGMLVLDIHIPEVSRIDLLEFLRRRNEWDELPARMLSTEAADVTVDKAMSLGANWYVRKTVTLKEFENTVITAFEMVQKG